jgi:4-amino-4-deoxy-L-arabinose transferase-like glycosyltransferase
VSTGVASVVSHREQAGERRRRARSRLAVCGFAAIFVLGMALRLWHLSSSPAWQWDEAVYYRVGISVQHGVLQEHPVFGSPWEPFLYQPPLYFVILARWFALVGASIYHARLLGAICSGIMLALLFRLISMLHGSRVALFAMAPVVFDGWLMYIERQSYIENALLVLIVGALLLYQRALERPSWFRFALAGFGVGCAGAFKQTGVYTVLAVLLCWLILRRNHREHFVLLGVAVAVLAAFTFAMVRMYDIPGHPWYIDQSLVQVRRVLGLQQSGGTLTSPTKLLHLLAAQYDYFIPSFLIALAALIVGLRRLLQCYRARNWVPAQANALLFSWFAAGVVVFGVSSLKFPQYFSLILIPGYCYLWTEFRNWRLPTELRLSASVVAALAGLGSLALVLPAFQANTLAQVQQYASARIPPHAIVVTEQSIGDLIQQRWCTVEAATACLRAASYSITWKTYLQSSFKQGDLAFQQLMTGAVPVRTFSGPIGTATIWKLKGKR